MPVVFYTIGHSRHPFDVFVDLLRAHGIEAVIDVRSQPYSRFSPQFNRSSLQAELGLRGIVYAFEGRNLGGRPDDADLYDADGYAVYARIARTRAFINSMERLKERGGAGERLAFMCAEEDPRRCHRLLLIGRVLAAEAFEVHHIRGDGRIETQATMDPTAVSGRQGLLLPVDDELAWRSMKPVGRRGGAPRV
jgi:uncharacterized protein (DUF488 family)